MNPEGRYINIFSEFSPPFVFDYLHEDNTKIEKFKFAPDTVVISTFFRTFSGISYINTVT